MGRIGLVDAAAPEVSGSPPKTPNVANYLPALAALCVETSRNPAMLGLFLKIIPLGPGTLAGLAGAARTKRIAA